MAARDRRPHCRHPRPAQRRGGLANPPAIPCLDRGNGYGGFIAQHPQRPQDAWEALRDDIHEKLRTVVGEARWEANDPDELWREDEEVRQAIRPVLADAAETAQFLAFKGIVLSSEARTLFLDCLYDDLAAALNLLIRNAGGDYSPDKYRERFPKFEGLDKGETPMQLFERWVVERKPAASSIESWRYVFSAMSEHFKGRSASSISAEEAQAWIRGLVSAARSARTVRRTWISASKAVFGWAFEHKIIPRNPFKDVKITVPKQIKHRETKSFLSQEYRTILKASLAITDTSKPIEAAKRWMPWLLAYTGARPGEIAQLRKEDVIERDGVHALRITPDAGSTKNNQVRVVPLHEHLVAQGLLTFVEGHADGPLFYKPRQRAKSSGPAKVSKAPAAQVRQRLAAWVGTLGVKDKDLSPNHAWRHTFIKIARRAEIHPAVINQIAGHANEAVGDDYGEATLEDMTEAMKKFPQYYLVEKTSMARRTRDEKKRNIGKQLRDARFAALDCRAISDKANKLVDRLSEDIAEWEIRYGNRERKRRSGAEKLRAAVTGLIGDLLLARKPGDKANGWVYRSMQARGFTGKRVSYRTFAALVDALKDLGLIEHRAPVNFWGPGFDTKKEIIHRRFASRLRANSGLLKLCRAHGITDKNIAEHFSEGLPEEPLARW